MKRIIKGDTCLEHIVAATTAIDKYLDDYGAHRRHHSAIMSVLYRGARYSVEVRLNKCSITARIESGHYRPACFSEGNHGINAA
ncbi:DUF4060 family protein [Aeromonas sp. R7-1]|uniref:DUF4060 family protein n=1 Tax=Aeromonas sp. R7-1 TaxID=3138473 RepID=UPI0034A3A18B